MESVYTRETVRRRSAARASVHGKKRRSGVALAPRERRRLLQLCICTVLFLVVFLGRGVFPERLEVVRGELLEVIRSDADFEAAFANLGRAIERREPVAEALGTLWTDIFSAGGGREPYVATMENTPFYQQEREFLRSNPDALQSMARRLGLSFQASETPTSTKEPELETSHRRAVPKRRCLLNRPRSTPAPHFRTTPRWNSSHWAWRRPPLLLWRQSPLLMVGGNILSRGERSSMREWIWQRPTEIPLEHLRTEWWIISEREPGLRTLSSAPPRRGCDLLLCALQ